MPSRDRDGYESLPRIPTAPHSIPRGLIPSPAPTSRRLHRAAFLANRTVGTIRGSWRGAYRTEEMELRERSEVAEWSRASNSQTSLVPDVFRRHVTAFPPDSVQAGSAAVTAAVGASSDGYTLAAEDRVEVNPEVMSEGRLPRGALCTADPENMAGPAEDSGKIAPENHCAAISWYYADPRRRMLLEDREVHWTAYHSLILCARRRPGTWTHAPTGAALICYYLLVSFVFTDNRNGGERIP